MNTKYYLVQEDHISGKISILKQCNKYNGLHEIEQLAETIVKKENGNQYLKYYKPNEHNRPFGFYIEKSRINGVTVKKKYSNPGYIFNDVFHQNIISFFLVEEVVKSYGIMDTNIILSDCSQKEKSMDNYNKVMVELLDIYPVILNNLKKYN